MHQDKGSVITWDNGLVVPDYPIIPFIEGDGIGSDITPAMIKVVDAACKRAYGDQRAIQWHEIYCGQKAYDRCGQWLPEETIKAIEQHFIAIKGPLATPVGGGIRSLNVAIRQRLGLYICQRPVRYFEGTPSPMKAPEAVDITVFRENSEDIYMGIEFQAGNAVTQALLETLQQDYGAKLTPNLETGVGIKLISQTASKRLVREAIQYAIMHDCASVALVHKGNIMKYTEGAFCQWGFEVIRDEFGGEKTEAGYSIYNPNTGRRIVVTDIIADACFQQVLLNPRSLDVIATMNLNGDYLSDALAAQVGGIGISPGANRNDRHCVFEATHGTAPLYAGKNLANPSSLILSAEMMLRHIGWGESADILLAAMKKAISSHHVTQDFAKYIEGAKSLKTSEFADYVCALMGVVA